MPTLIAGVLATFIPLYIGLFLPAIANRSSKETQILLASFASGIMFWFFLDVMNDAALLDVNQGFTYGNPISHIVLALLFAVGVIALFGLEPMMNRKFPVSTVKSSPADESISTKITFVVSALVAIGIGAHAIGEGIDIGSIIPDSSNIIQAIGGVGPGIAYIFHKILEGFVIGTFAAIAQNISAKRIGILGLVAGIPTIIGFFVGLSSLVDSTYFFAIGGASVIYVEYKLIPITMQSERKYAPILVLLLGIYAMYLAGLLHG